MIAEIFSTVNRTRFSGIRIVPVNAPSLYQECVRQFVAELNRSNQNGKRISELQFLPTSALVAIFDEMCTYPALRGLIGEQLSRPILFMKMFADHNASLLVIQQCLREASRGGKPVLPDLTRNYCAMVLKEPLIPGSQAFMTRLERAMKLSNFLFEAGWDRCSVSILNIIHDMIAEIKDHVLYNKLRIDCAVKMLRAQADCMPNEAEKTCKILLELASYSTDTKILTRVYLQVADYYYFSDRYDLCHEWAINAMNLITDSSPIDDVIQVLELEALYSISKQQCDLGNMLISQAVIRCLEHYGERHRRYADSLIAYGVCLLEMNAFTSCSPVFAQALEILSQFYGCLTPHIPTLLSYMAYSCYMRSFANRNFVVAQDTIKRALHYAEQIDQLKPDVKDQLYQVYGLILTGYDSHRASIKEIHPIHALKHERLSFAEIREKYYELNASFEGFAI